MNLSSVFEVASAIIISLGGAAIFLATFSAWLGKVWASRILANEKARLEEDLEVVKKKYQLEIEQYKASLQFDFEKNKTVFNRFFETQFKLYCEIWAALSEVEMACEKLWEDASRTRVAHLAKALSDAKKTINSGSLVLENSHYNELIRIIVQFENYKLGKLRLSEAKTSRDDNIYNDDSIRQMISENGAIRSNYKKIIDEVRLSFKAQLQGNYN